MTLRLIPPLCIALITGCTITRPPADGETGIVVCIFAHCDVNKRDKPSPPPETTHE